MGADGPRLLFHEYFRTVRNVPRTGRCTLPVRVESTVSRSVSRDDVVLQRPEDVRVVLPVFHTATASAGAASSYVLRRIAYRAGALAPGIQEFTFHELTTQMDGGTLERVQSWF